jgi:hypothetical protein
MWNDFVAVGGKLKKKKQMFRKIRKKLVPMDVSSKLTTWRSRELHILHLPFDLDDCWDDKEMNVICVRLNIVKARHNSLISLWVMCESTDMVAARNFQLCLQNFQKWKCTSVNYLQR